MPLHPTKPRELIYAGAKRGIECRDELERFWLEPPYTLVHTSRPENGVPGGEARVTGDDILKVFRTPLELGKHIGAK